MKSKIIDMNKYRNNRRKSLNFLLAVPIDVEILDVISTKEGVIVSTSDGPYIVAWDGSGAKRIEYNENESEE